MISAEAPTKEIVMMKQLGVSAVQFLCLSRYHLLLFFSELPLGWGETQFTTPGRTSASAGTSVSVPQNIWFPLIEVISIFDICLVFNVLQGSGVFPDPLFVTVLVIEQEAFFIFALENQVILPARTEARIDPKHVEQRCFYWLHGVKVRRADTFFSTFSSNLPGFFHPVTNARNILIFVWQAKRIIMHQGKTAWQELCLV